MDKTNAYLATLNEKQRSELERVRDIIKATAPDAEESFGYGMPTLKYKGKYLIGYCAFKEHMSVFPGSEAVELIKQKLTDHKVSKGTIQFTFDKPLSEELIREIVLIRMHAIDSE